MNREERRKMGISKDAAKKLEQLKGPCSVMEAVQLAQGVAEDAISNYHQSINPIIVSLSIQVEVLKELLFADIPVGNGICKKGIISEETFVKLFEERVADYNKQKEEALKKMAESAESEEDIPEEEPSAEVEETSDPVTDVKTNVTPFPVQVDISKK